MSAFFIASRHKSILQAISHYSWAILLIHKQVSTIIVVEETKWVPTVDMAPLCEEYEGYFGL